MSSISFGTGRRKSAVARVRLIDGSGRFFVNKKEDKEYFTLPKYKTTAIAPLVALKVEKDYDIHVTTRGGGIRGQADAIQLGIARALAKISPDYEKTLRDGKFVTRDARVKERKKYGRRGARRGFQFSKR